MKGKFNTIKKSRKQSKDIDEKIEYLNKECQKTGLNEITMSTSGIYFSAGEEENPANSTFTNASFGGRGLAMTSFSGLSIGGATTNDTGFSFAPDGSGPATSYKGIASGFQPAVPGSQRSPEHRKIGAFLWYWDGSNYKRLEWKFNNQNVDNSGQWAQWKSGAFNPFLDPIIGDASFDSNLLAAIISAGGGGAFPDPDDITPPTNPVLFKNNLDDPSFTPINIGEMSPQAYEYFRRRVNGNNNVASGGVNYDLYNYLDKRYGIEASNWYENNPTLPHESNPFIPTPEAPYVPLASNPNQPVSDTNIPSPYAGAQDGDEFAFFGGGNNKNTPPPPPTRRTRKGSTDATKASTGMYPSMTPEIFQQKYGISYSEYLKLP